MHKVITIFVIIPTFAYALYNPFFSEPPRKTVKTTQVQKPVKRIYIKPKQTPTMKEFKMKYFGFVESNKGKFALVKFNDKNIVIKKDDSIYIDDSVFKIINITSNNIVIKDNYSKFRTVYFSSENQRQNQWQQQ